MYRLLKWEKPRGIPNKEIYAEGMVCELDDSDIAEAEEFCEVTIHATKDDDE
jgi:hypothetical protein